MPTKFCQMKIKGVLTTNLEQKVSSNKKEEKIVEEVIKTWMTYLISSLEEAEEDVEDLVVDFTSRVEANKESHNMKTYLKTLMLSS